MTDPRDDDLADRLDELERMFGLSDPSVTLTREVVGPNGDVVATIEREFGTETYQGS